MAPRLAFGVLFPSVLSLLSVKVVTWAEVKGVYVTGQELEFLQHLEGLVSLAGLGRARGRWATIHSRGLDVSSKACVLDIVLGMVRGGGPGGGGGQCAGLLPWSSSRGTLVLHRRLS